MKTKSKAPYQIHLKDGTYFEFETYAEFDEVRCQLSTGDYHTATFVNPKTRKSKRTKVDMTNVIFVDFVNRRKVS